jgi:hypothetical protein
MANVAISGDTSGAITLSAPAVAGTNTITLPASTGTMVTTGSPQSGSVIQVVTAANSTSFTTSSSSNVNTGLSVSITPKFNTSKILTIVTANSDTLGSGGQISATVYRNAVNLSSGGTPAGFAQIYAAAIRVQAPISIAVLDSPATTSATTYALYIASTNSGSVGINYNSETSNITVMEIAA